MKTIEKVGSDKPAEKTPVKTQEDSKRESRIKQLVLTHVDPHQKVVDTKVIKLYGNCWRVNVYGEDTQSEFEIIKTNRIIHSEFVRDN